VEVSKAFHTPEVLMSHRNARLTPRGRLLLVERILAGYRVSDVAAQLGCSRTCAYKWLYRYRTEGPAGLVDRTSAAHRIPHRIAPELEWRACELRRRYRRGPEWIAAELGMCAAPVGRILARHRMPALRDLDALTGIPVRRGPATGIRYERATPGEMIHIDVKKLGRIPDGGGWRATGRGYRPHTRRGHGFDYVHAAIDDHSRLAYAEIHPDETGATCAGFLERAAAYFAEYGITRIERVMTDNAFAYRLSHDFQAALGRLGVRHVLIRPHCPWQNGKMERLNRTLQQEWAYQRPFASNDERAHALPQWLEYYNTRRRQSALGGRAPISRLSPMR
jgi:transposase InsO family protein